jgi:hypothetical protein
LKAVDVIRKEIIRREKIIEEKKHFKKTIGERGIVSE